jgi:hypothetical protein
MNGTHGRWIDPVAFAWHALNRTALPVRLTPLIPFDGSLLRDLLARSWWHR